MTTISTFDRANGQIESGGKTRYYLLYVPDTYDPTTPTSLVICIHGFIQWPAHQAILSGWNALADEHGFIVVYPEGTGIPLRWNVQPLPFNPNTPAQDVQFISDLIDNLSQDYNIDQARIYANGMSIGAGMAHVLGCTLSDRIAAIGGVAGAYLYPWKDCKPARPMPVIAFHGTADPIVPYYGGQVAMHRFHFAPVAEWAARWAERNGCAAEPEVIPPVRSVHRVRYCGCDQGAEVIFYTIDGGGHTWPGGSELPAIITGTTSQDVNATQLMWDFFTRMTANT